MISTEEYRHGYYQVHQVRRDAEACAMIALAAMEAVGAENVGQLAGKLGIALREIRLALG